MPTLKTYSSKLFRDVVFKKGTRSLRGSYNIIPTEPVQVGNERQLLMDFHVIDDLNNCRRTVHEPAKHPDNPVIKPDDLENGANAYGGTVMHDPGTGRLRMWFARGDDEPYGDVPTSCCCESDDGLNWRPAEHKGGRTKVSKSGHAFLDATRTKAHTVVLLPERMRSLGRYGAIYPNYLRPEQISDPETMHNMRHFAAFSEDGIDWTDAPQNPVWMGRSDCSNTVVYNDERDVFMIYRRSTINAGQVRRIAYSESKDLISWSQPRTVITRGCRFCFTGLMKQRGTPIPGTNVLWVYRLRPKPGKRSPMEDTQDLSAHVTKLQENVLRWEDRLRTESGGPDAFRQAMGELRASLDAIGRAGFLRLAQAGEVAAETLVGEGRIYRFKQVVDKEWMSLWGKVAVPRRLYQEDHGGPSRVPLDERCGMSGRFMVPELERVTAFLGARLVAAEVEDSLGEVLPEPPSRTAIQHVLTAVGQCAEDGAEQLELSLETAAPLNAEGDTLVVSWDGVMVPLREPAPKRGRPAERPMATDTAPTAWKEAGVGMVATYLTPLDPDTEEPQRVDVRYAARMPEAKMATLVNGLVDQTIRAMQQSVYDHLVILADGRREIWRTVDEHAEFDGFIRILDFYHAAQHLSMAAEHLFGKASAKADRWYRSWRHKLRHEPGAVASLIRSLRYHRRRLPRRSERYRRASTELGYFTNNRDKMDYARYHATGLIISSGPVEAAAKTIVGHRLKRSGMRWTRQGGQHILNLRVLVQSNRWDPFWNWYLEQTTPLTTLKKAA